MGTIHEQPQRDFFHIDMFDVETLTSKILDISQKFNVDIKYVIEIYKALELRRKNDLFAANGDIFDEQIAGLAEILLTLKNGDDE